MIIKRTINFLLEQRKKDDKIIITEVPIRMRVTYKSMYIDFSTGYRIDESKWDKNKQKVKNGYNNKLKQTSTEINSSLLFYSITIQEIFKEFEVKNIIPSKSELKECFKKKTTLIINDNIAKEVINFFDSIDLFIKESGTTNNWTIATLKKFKTVKNHLNNFNSKLTFDYFDESGLNNYLNFLRNEKKMLNSSIKKHLGFLKWFLKWGLNKKIHNNNAFINYIPKLKNSEKKVIFLTLEELNKIKNYQIPAHKLYLERVRDVYLFMCYSGIRHSDAYHLKKTDIKENYFEITTIKTSDNLKIELNNYSKEILSKYQNINFLENKALPVISNQKMNLYLKELAELAEINEPIRQTFYKGNERIDIIEPKYSILGTHSARRTFICNALALGIPAHVIMNWTGHSDYKSMKPYIGVADDVKAINMNKFNEL